MTTYSPAILAWADIDPDSLARIERDADSAHVVGMHDTRVEIIASNAFNGMGDSTGSDDYGFSVAWVDLADHIDYAEYADDMPAGVDYWNVGAYLATCRDVAGCRYALAYWDANGARSAIGYDTRASMMLAYRAIESEYLAWEDSAE